jgi:hypothetical protein
VTSCARPAPCIVALLETIALMHFEFLSGTISKMSFVTHKINDWTFVLTRRRIEGKRAVLSYQCFVAVDSRMDCTL